MTSCAPRRYPPEPMRPVVLGEGFWKERQRALLDRGLAHQWQQCEETPRLENFRRAARGETTGHEGRNYDDSDLYKLSEATVYALALDPSHPVRKPFEEFVRTLGQAQQADGYVHTFHQLGRHAPRYSLTAAYHEQYCLGHLIEAGVAEAESLGEGPLYAVAKKAADHLTETFGPGRMDKLPGHPEPELALARLSQWTGDAKYRELAKWQVLRRGQRPSPFEQELSQADVHPAYHALFAPRGTYEGHYAQDDRPLIEADTPVGHAVRAVYLYCGAVDAAPEETMPTLHRLWDSLTRHRMYITGGIGSAGYNEGFTEDFDLPNRDAYAETCAAIGLVFWAQRMGRATGQSKFADVMERALYNAVLSGMDLTGTGYFYDNPLESRGEKVRKPWFDCACCPPNIARLILSIERYLARVEGQTVTIEIPDAMKITVAGGPQFRVETEYPHASEVHVAVEQAGHATLRLRIPNWCRDARASLNGEMVNEIQDGYLIVTREWQTGDTLRLDLAMPAEWMVADSRIPDAADLLALRRGPVIYAWEEADAEAPLHLYRLDPSRHPEINGHEPHGPSLVAAARLESDHWTRDTAYVPYPGPQEAPRPARAVAVPYWTWGNRGTGAMRVWMRRVSS